MICETVECNLSHNFILQAQLLMIVHHRNLVSLIGYCDEGDKLGLIYEYMANGNLQSHISGKFYTSAKQTDNSFFMPKGKISDYADKSLDYLTWEDRLHIALDSAQGMKQTWIQVTQRL